MYICVNIFHLCYIYNSKKRAVESQGSKANVSQWMGPGNVTSVIWKSNKHS